MASLKISPSGIGRATCLAAYIVAVAVLSCFHEFWLDEIHPWEMDTNMSLCQVIGSMAAEGHFATWHLLLMPLAKLGVSVIWGMPLVSILVMGTGAWWLVYRSDFSLTAKFCILFSAPSLYFFPVMCRVYAIIPLLLWLVAYCYGRRRTSPIAYGVSLGLLFNTHMFMEGLAIALFLFWAIEIFRQKVPEGDTQASDARRRSLIALAIAAFLALLAFAQIVGNFFLPETMAYKRLSTAHQLLAEFPDRYMSLVFVVASKATASFLPEWLISSILLVVLVAVYCRLMKGSPAPLAIVAIALVYQVVFAMCVYSYDGQRFYLPFYIMIFGLWIGGKAGKRAVTWFVAALFLLNLNVEYAAVKNDIVSEFEIYNAAAREYNADSNDVKYINWQSGTVRFFTSCYGHTPDTEIRFDNESQIYESLQATSPEAFSVYGAFQLWESEEEITDYHTLCDSLTALGYTVEYTERPFKQISGSLVIVKASRRQ